MKEKILIVEDDTIALEGLKLSLENEGYHILALNSGKRALEMLTNEAFDLVLSDIVMADVSGLDLLLHIKKKYPETIVILITGYGSLDIVIEALRQGAYDYLLKPCSDEELKIRIKRGLEKRRMGQIIKEKNRQEALIEFVGGFANTLNNLVAGISSNYEMLSTYIDNDECPEIQEIFQNVALYINQSARILDKLSSATNLFSNSEIAPFELENAFLNIKTLFAQDVIDLNVPSKLPWVYGNNQLSTAFINIIQNSIEASQKGQKVKISVSIDRTGEFVELVFEDNGCGIASDDLSKVFIPFYTTKNSTNAGLGLWVAYQTITYYKGTINITSEKGIGTTVSIRLPIYRKQESIQTPFYGKLD